MKKELTIQDTFAICKQLWTWCAKTGLGKDEWPEWEQIRQEYGLSDCVDCVFCVYSYTYTGWCDKCPILKLFNNCFETYFKQWADSQTQTDRMKYAQLFLGQIEAVEKIYIKNNYFVDKVWLKLYNGYSGIEFLEDLKR